MRLLGMDTCPSLNDIMEIRCNTCTRIKVITKLPNSEQFYKGKVKTHNSKRAGVRFLNLPSCMPCGLNLNRVDTCSEQEARFKK